MMIFHDPRDHPHPHQSRRPPQKKKIPPPLLAPQSYANASPKFSPEALVAISLASAKKKFCPPKWKWESRGGAIDFARHLGRGV